MRIAIFGASGATGQLLTERSLAAGHQVTALLRTPDTFLYRYRDRVHIVPGNAFDPQAIARTLEGADAVLSALGARSLKREDVLERAIPLIVEAMHHANIRRIIALGSGGALPDSLDKQPAYRRWISEKILYKTLLKWPVASQISQYATLSSSNLDWTMVMPPMLTNSHGRGSYRIDGDALPRNGARIARADVADFMMQQLTSSEWFHKGVYLAW